MEKMDSGLKAKVFGFDEEELFDMCEPDAPLFDPVAGVLERATQAHVISSARDRGSCSPDFLKTNAGDVDEEDPFQLVDAPLSIAQSEPGGRFTMAKKLGIVRTEEKIEDGAKWMLAFNAAGECVRWGFIGRA